MNYIRMSVLFVLLILTKNLFATPIDVIGCQAINPMGLNYAPKLHALIACDNWNVWRHFNVSVKPEELTSKKDAITSGPFYGHFNDSENLYHIKGPVLSQFGPIFSFTHSEPIPGHFIESIINIDTGGPMQNVVWEEGCIGIRSASDPVQHCIFTVSARDFKTISAWMKRQKYTPSLAVTI